MESPSVQRRRLGLALKRAREEAGKTQDEAGEVIDAAGSKISRIELGQSGLRQTDLAVLLDFYGIEGGEAESLKAMARAGRQRGRWSGYHHAIPRWFRQYVDLESGATDIRWYQSEIMPGILQTESYIQAVNAGSTSRSREDEAERQAQIKIRLERQEILESTQLEFILSESALRRVVGDQATMHGQLKHLVEVSKRPNIAVQVLPFTAETFVMANISFVSLRFGDADSDVIYVEGYTSADYLDHPEDVQAYTRLWNRLQAAALGPAESARMVKRLAEELRPAMK